jgi:glycosyltransferase involved in cell wall biosynthesis
VVPNWANIDEIQLNIDVNEYRQRIGIPKDGFVLVYAGNIGEASGIDTLLISFKRITPNNGIYLILAGEGNRLENCREIAKEISGMSVMIHSPWDASETSLVLRSADLLLLPTKNDQSLASIPSKLIYYMLASRPIFALAHPESEISGIINRAKCGWISYLDQPEELMEKILLIKNGYYGDLERYGRSGRDYAISHFSRESCLPKIISIIKTIAISNNRL